ncbi:hypothetical protein RHGRI_001651 [Rhododendron griersonianum]|uniref:Uncharacterized protein n=2 Tax=Rhododendron griersonianum TaxID=479676 RepID=A0AAV6LP39_9ERIC|nr:hypothetical protein RHGRI_001651 [Rhododendron griersonianum]
MPPPAGSCSSNIRQGKGAPSRQGLSSIARSPTGYPLVQPSIDKIWPQSTSSSSGATAPAVVNTSSIALHIRQSTAITWSSPTNAGPGLHTRANYNRYGLDLVRSRSGPASNHDLAVRLNIRRGVQLRRQQRQAYYGLAITSGQLPATERSNPDLLVAGLLLMYKSGSGPNLIDAQPCTPCTLVLRAGASRAWVLSLSSDLSTNQFPPVMCQDVTAGGVIPSAATARSSPGKGTSLSREALLHRPTLKPTISGPASSGPAVFRPRQQQIRGLTAFSDLLLSSIGRLRPGASTHQIRRSSFPTSTAMAAGRRSVQYRATGRRWSVQYRATGRRSSNTAMAADFTKMYQIWPEGRSTSLSATAMAAGFTELKLWPAFNSRRRQRVEVVAGLSPVGHQLQLQQPAINSQGTATPWPHCFSMALSEVALIASHVRARNCLPCFPNELRRQQQKNTRYSPPNSTHKPFDLCPSPTTEFKSTSPSLEELMSDSSSQVRPSIPENPNLSSLTGVQSGSPSLGSAKNQQQTLFEEGLAKEAQERARHVHHQQRTTPIEVQSPNSSKSSPSRKLHQVFLEESKKLEAEERATLLHGNTNQSVSQRIEIQNANTSATQVTHLHGNTYQFQRTPSEVQNCNPNSTILINARGTPYVQAMVAAAGARVAAAGIGAAAAYIQNMQNQQQVQNLHRFRTCRISNRFMAYHVWFTSLLTATASSSTHNRLLQQISADFRTAGRSEAEWLLLPLAAVFDQHLSAAELFCDD